MSTRSTQQRLRLRYAQQGTLRFVGHLDITKIWERILRRAELPLEYSRGFNPRPRLQVAAGLPLGASSAAEALDVWLEAPVWPSDDLRPRLQAVAPRDLTLLSAEAVPIQAPALPMLAHSATYQVRPLPPARFPEGLPAQITALLQADQLLRQRKRKTYDLRPLILGLGQPAEQMLEMQLSLGEGRTGRPDETLAALGLAEVPVQIHRSALELATTLLEQDHQE
ncbi:MAG: DUF2344 domain-containing protein [Anaerolineae bacterium]|nr:DUF2344 domain-containing protein [Anaerolineae bacterium]